MNIITKSYGYLSEHVTVVFRICIGRILKSQKVFYVRWISHVNMYSTILADTGQGTGGSAASLGEQCSPFL